MALHRYARTLETAAHCLGGPERLAALLDVPARTVRMWLRGEQAPPLGAFLAALDVVADGPFAPRRRKVRVAVLR
ncbi:MAG: hypothetical protein ACT4P3_22100 [Betaproteobacteria bacterium]